MRLPFLRRSVGHVGGGLIFGDIRGRRILSAPMDWDAPKRLDNSGYCTPLEEQGHNPWCAAYAMCQLLQASYWRQHNVRQDFTEAACYQEAKAIDNSPGDGTTLEAVVTVAQTVDLSGRGLMPTIAEQCLTDAQDVTFAVHKYGLVLVGLQITTGWQTPKRSGMIGDDTRQIGGHAVLVSGYDLEAGSVWGPNWWGKAWGNGGFWSMTREQFERQFMYGYGCSITWSHS
jgi:hypothetical protein